MTTTKPSLFIIGAPKCGTSSVNHYLDQHPQIAMADKEMHFFGEDLGIIREAESESAYLEKFSSLEGEVIGESSVWTLFSKKASEQIREFNPEARILAMIRNPWDVLPSLHAQHLYDADEKLLDLNEALERDLLRSPEEETAWSKNFRSRPLLWRSVLYSEHIQSWKEQWGDQFKVLLFDDLVKDPASLYRDLCHWLKLREDFIPDFEVLNARKGIRSPKIQSLVDKPAPTLKKIVRAGIPSKKLRHKIMSGLKSANQTRGTEMVLSLENQLSLENLIRTDIERLEKLLQTDLSYWS